MGVHRIQAGQKFAFLGSDIYSIKVTAENKTYQSDIRENVLSPALAFRSGNNFFNYMGTQIVGRKNNSDLSFKIDRVMTRKNHLSMPPPLFEIANVAQSHTIGLRCESSLYCFGRWSYYALRGTSAPRLAHGEAMKQMKQTPYSTKRLQNVSVCANNKFKRFGACNTDSDGKISNYDNGIYDIIDCENYCRTCKMCNFISYTPATCSWHHRCDMKTLLDGNAIVSSVAKPSFLDTDSNFCNVEYIEEEKGTSMCVVGENIQTAGECEVAAQVVSGAIWSAGNSIKMDPSYPKGCFRVGGLIFFNNVVAGIERGEASLICRVASMRRISIARASIF